MQMQMEITFPGGKRVDASFNGHTVRTDQPPQGGGDGSAPAPYEVFLSSIGTCAGIYVLGFCQARGIPTEGLRLVQTNEWSPLTGKLARVRLDLELPPGFPAKYRDAVRRAAEMCAVKKTLESPPEMVVEPHLAADSAAA